MDRLTPERRSENMRRIRSKGMRPELLVRRLIHGMGYRFRLHRKDLPGKPDLVFPARHKVILVHGCFWHQHPDPACRDARVPLSNADYWQPKLARNQDRDGKAVAALQSQGWEVMVIWECEIKGLEVLAGCIRQFLGPAGSQRSPAAGS